MHTTQLLSLREQIDDIDTQIVSLLQERAAIAKQVGAAKQGSAVYRPEREAQVLRRAVAGKGPLPAIAVTAIYKEIIAACRNLQQPLRVAYLGPAGTYSEQAAQQYCGVTSQYQPYASLDAAVGAAEKEEADLALLPIENSTEGAVNRTLDILIQTPLRLCGEVMLPIHHQLLASAGSLEDITQVAAHPQALAQCSRWLDAHLPHAKRIDCASNAAAAQLAAQQSSTAAIAGQAAATAYELPILARNIEDEANNTTRFVALGVHTPAPTGNDKTSLVCSVPNTPGSLGKLLAVFADAGINMTKLESRPARSVLWDYLFLIDIDGHQDDPALAAALAAAKEQVLYITVLGSYPKAA